MKKLLLALSLVGVLFASSAFAGPFGTRMGQSLEETKNVYLEMHKLTQFGEVYSSSKGHPDVKEFKNFILYFEENKLCKIIGFSSEYNAMQIGLSKLAMENFKKILISKYGEPVNLEKRTGEYDPYIWNLKDSDIQKIILDYIYADNMIMISLAYEYKNFDKFTGKKELFEYPFF